MSIRTPSSRERRAHQEALGLWVKLKWFQNSIVVVLVIINTIRLRAQSKPVPMEGFRFFLGRWLSPAAVPFHRARSARLLGQAGQ